MTQPLKPLKILWAIDAFDDLKETQDKEVAILRRLAARQSLTIDPTYVLSPADLGLHQEVAGGWLETYTPASKKALAQKVSRCGLSGIREPQVLLNQRSSLSASVAVLIRFARTEGYDFILTGSHGRRGFSRMMMGSFAEELLLRSEIPVLIVGPHAREWRDDKVELLLPNDLTHPEAPVFEVGFDLSHRLAAPLTLLAVLPKPVEPILQSGVYLASGGWVPALGYLGKQRERQEDLATQVMARAQAREVTARHVVDDTSLSVLESVLTHARQMSSGLIVMAAESGPISTALLGSVTRHTVRAASCPVFIVRGK